MNYSLQYSRSNTVNMAVTPRKRSLKHRLLTVSAGLVLIKLKKLEYALKPGDSFWVPFDCLVAYTYFPGSEVAALDISARLTDPFPTKAGYLQLPPVTKAILDKLATGNCSQAHINTLLQVIREELSEINTDLTLNTLSKQFSDWAPESPSDLAQDIQLALKLREARKQLLSGSKRENIIQQLFCGDSEEFERLSQLVFGEKL